MRIEEIHEHLLKFGDELLTLGKPITDNRLELFEDRYKINLTEEFKYLFKKHNGFSLGNEVYGLGEEFKSQSLDKMYELLHSHFQDFIPKEIVPISPDGFGNYYCLDLTRENNGSCPVIFYQHDYGYTNLRDIETCNINFAEWINEICITSTLEDYDYSGNRKSGLKYKLRQLFVKNRN